MLIFFINPASTTLLSKQLAPKRPAPKSHVPACGGDDFWLTFPDGNFFFRLQTLHLRAFGFECESGRGICFVKDLKTYLDLIHASRTVLNNTRTHGIRMISNSVM